MRPLQPLLHEQVVLVSAPAQLLSDPNGSMGSQSVQGLYHSDVRALRGYTLSASGSTLEHLSFQRHGSASARHLLLARHLDPEGADPRTMVSAERTLTTDVSGATLTESLTLQAAWRTPVSTTLTVELSSDLSAMDLVKSGDSLSDLPWTLAENGSATVRREAASVTVHAPDARLTLNGSTLLLQWDAVAGATSPFTTTWTLRCSDEAAVVQPARTLPARKRPEVKDLHAALWSATALDDLDHLLLARRESPSQPFAAAGAPWFLTLFGRDSLWTARLLLQKGDPWSLALAEGTLRTLADLQGRKDDPATAEQPGKIMHELRRGLNIVDATTVLPPLYFGTIDATELWVLTLREAHQAGLPDEVVLDLLPALRRALTWLTDHADSDGDGFIEYGQGTDQGLANQGWKDSGDSVQHRDGSLAQGPIALVEVQAYAYAAARAGALTLRSLAQSSHDLRRAQDLEVWAGSLRDRFTDAFWLGDSATGYPVIALDSGKKKVESLTSNIGHLLGTGILDQAQSRRVANLLVSPEMSSGYGLRTLATTMGGYWPLSYHGGSVWTHDTAIAVDGLLRDGFLQEARALARGLVAAAPSFGYRMPELYSGAPAEDGAPSPYPSSCRPQAWAAAASAVAARAL